MSSTKCYCIIALAFVNITSTNAIEFLGFPKPLSLNFTEITAKYGYLTQEHAVVTEDGYILTIFRIIQGRQCKGPKKEPPVILQHGLLQSSDAWLDSGPEIGLGYFLADQCYDLWVANQRGNYYGRRHKYLNPDKDPEFWRFSIDEIGKYDIPATIDYVLDYTGAAKVNYIGYNQGSSTFYIMCSERPGYCNKAQVIISLAPSTRQLNTKSIGFSKTIEFFALFQKIIEASGIYEAFPKGGALQTFLGNICQFQIAYPFCETLKSLFDASHPGSINQETITQFYQHFPGGTSVQTLAKYGQSLHEVDFVKFNYGIFQNLKVYGSIRPPIYNLSAVTTPVVVIYGNNDGIVDKEDVRGLLKKLPNVLEAFLVKDPLWTHFDQAYSQFAPVQTYPKIIEYLTKYSYSFSSNYL